MVEMSLPLFAYILLLLLYAISGKGIAVVWQGEVE